MSNTVPINSALVFSITNPVFNGAVLDLTQPDSAIFLVLRDDTGRTTEYQARIVSGIKASVSIPNDLFKTQSTWYRRWRYKNDLLAPQADIQSQPWTKFLAI